MSDWDEKRALERAQRKESRRLEELLEKTPIRRRNLLKPVIENTAWMKVQLDKARELIGTEPIVTEYDNGGGQTGVREHPAYKAYEALWKAYMTGMGRILEAIPAGQAPAAPEEEPETAAPPQTVLELIRARHELGA